MFDISWTDPKRETVGERKNRKELQSNGHSAPSRTSSTRSSKSPESLAQHSRPSVFSRLGGKKANLNRVGSNTKLSVLRNDDSIKASRRVSSYTVASASPSPGVAGPSNNIRRIPENGYFNGPPYIPDTEPHSSRSSEVAESVFSARTARSATTASSWASLLDSLPRKGSTSQPLSPKSFVTRTSDMTPLTLSPRPSIGPAEEVTTIVHVATAETIPIQSQDSPIKSYARPNSTKAYAKTCRSPSTFDSPVPPALGSPTSTILDSSAADQSWSPEHLMPKPLLSMQPLKPPSTPFRSISPHFMLSQPQRQVQSQPKRRRERSPPELSHLQRQIRRMEAASPKIILERLKEEWVEVADASVYRELELEKQRWMLFALRDLKNKTSGSKLIRDASGGLDLDGRREGRKVLSLFENHASASFLSALSPTTQIHHLSSTPLSPKYYPNIYPRSVPLSPPTTILPYSSNTFTSITSFSLPSLLPASSLPTILAECHRVLVPGGMLHLTILDPSPLPSTLGPKLRAWLDEHLLLHLERQFRPLNPSRLFPAWLRDVGLRSEGSTRLTVPGLSGGMKGEIVKQELKSVVGRMLWKEMWGPYVQGDRWWWEDEEIVEECEGLRTCWSWEVLEGVKAF
ncbi:hypothetical protein B0J14DRAFT_488964 [Halenospora varia]|nr:hypothetical protein B0J14DRAFT_488964 [Halenospora varia]